MRQGFHHSGLTGAPDTDHVGLRASPDRQGPQLGQGLTAGRQSNSGSTQGPDWLHMLITQDPRGLKGVSAVFTTSVSSECGLDSGPAYKEA